MILRRCGQFQALLLLAFAIIALICLPFAIGSGSPSFKGKSKLSPLNSELEARAKAVLLSNWLGHSTKPAPLLYPHQWSWDSAFIALGKSYYDQEQAQEELRTLFKAQWKNGLVPHIVFNPAAPDYFPGPSWWNTANSSTNAPRSIATSGILQPPVHAIAALKIWENRVDDVSAISFLNAIFGPLKLWHTYLYEERHWAHGLVWIRHPWESGMDNSPLWDEAMLAIDLKPGMVPPYNRSDNKIVNSTDRPTQWQYDRFVWLVEQAKKAGYEESAIVNIKNNNFLIVDVLFNSILVQADIALAEIALIIGSDPTPMKTWAATTAAGIQSVLWDSNLGTYRNYDLIKGGLTASNATYTLTSFSPMYASIPANDQVVQMLGLLTSNRFATLAEVSQGKVWPYVSFDRTSPAYISHNYWRGPVWINTNWIIYKGLLNYQRRISGLQEAASALKNATLDLVMKTGIFEYFDALDGGSGHGTDNFSWTASLVIDLLNEDIQ